ncbi:MAG TPA: hypothetical protein DCS43_01455 [Verrucomicrobia bacterium]|nr:hypothetical protein [Verrucomicrobiota bacterium]
MNREFKFRHANEIAGVFVIGAAVLFVLGVIFAGRSQGWFEQRFTLMVVFDTIEGSFGLQEGAPVLVRNTTAGRVGPVLPTPDGLMGTTLVLKDRFRPFITTDSVAKIKKQFGVAGDSYVDIARGQGTIIQDGARITCIKDEELLETAQKMLTDVQASVLPILERVESIINSVASILEQVDKGDGVVGASISDATLRDDVKSIVSNMEVVSGQAETTIGAISTLVSNDVARVINNTEVISTQVAELMQRDVPQLAGESVKLASELTRTLTETRRLITGIQRHWLLRRYVENDPEVLSLVPGSQGWFRGQDDVEGALQQDLIAARTGDDAQAVRQHAANLAIFALDAGDLAQAETYLEEIRFARRLTGGTETAREQLLAAEISRRRGDLEKAQQLAEQAGENSRGRSGHAVYAESRLLLASVFISTGQMDDARRMRDDASKAVKKEGNPPLLAAAIAGLSAALAVMEGDFLAAASGYGAQAELLKQIGMHHGMTVALCKAGEIYSQLGMASSGTSYYLRAAGSLLACGDRAEAESMFQRASEQAAASGDELLQSRVETMRRERGEK